MGLSNAAYNLGLVSGLKSGAERVKAEREHDEDRARMLARQKTDDAWVDETRTAAREDRQAQKAARAITTEKAQVELDRLKQDIEDEGALDFMYDLESGTDPQQAVARHNSRGRTKIIPESIKYDAATKTVTFESPDANGDGVPERFTHNVPQTIEQLERITGTTKGRYVSVSDGSKLYDTRTRQVVVDNPDDVNPNASTRGGRTHVVGKTLVDDQGRVIYRDRTAGASAGETKFNPQTFSKDTTNALGKLLGGKYDPSTEQFEFAGGTAKMTKLTRIAQRMAQRMLKHKGRISADMIAGIVADLSQDFDEKAIREKARADAEANVDGKGIAPDDATQREKGRLFGLGAIKPDVLKRIQDDAVQDALVNLEVQAQTALDSEVTRMADDVYRDGGFTGDSQADVDALDGNDDEPDDDQDSVPAVSQTEAKDGGDWPKDAPPQAAFRSLPRGKRLRNKRTGEEWELDDSGVPRKVTSGR